MNKNIVFKSIIVFVLTVILIGLSACEPKISFNQESDEEKILKVLNSFDVKYLGEDSINSVTNDIVFTYNNSSNCVISVESSNPEIISNEGVVTRPEEDTKVTITIKVSVGDTFLSKSIKLLVLSSEGGNPSIEPTEKDVVDISISDALALSIEAGATTEIKYQMTGLIKSVDNATYGNMYITDGEKDFYIYGVLNESGAKYSELDYKPIAGDTITVVGQIKNYNGTLELFNAILKNVTQGEHVALELETIDKVLEKEEGSQAKTSGTVIGTHARGFLVQDSTGTILVYMNRTAFTYKTGDVVTVEGSLTKYHERIQFAEGATISKTSTMVYNYPSAIEIDGSNIEQEIESPEMGKYVVVEGTLKLEGTYYNLEVEGSEKTISLTYPTDASIQLLNKGIGSVVKLNGFILDASSDSTRLNIMFIGFEGEIEVKTSTLPQTYDFTVSSKDSTVLPEGWTWIKAGKAYATLWQSFRNNGEGIQSPLFEAVDGVKVSFRYYLNNSTTGSSKLKITAYDATGAIVSTIESDNIGQGDTGVNNAKTLEFTLTGTSICSISIEMIKEGGGNIAFNQIILESLN